MSRGSARGHPGVSRRLERKSQTSFLPGLLLHHLDQGLHLSFVIGLLGHPPGPRSNWKSGSTATCAL